MNKLKYLLLSLFLIISFFTVPMMSAEEYGASEEAKGIVSALALMLESESEEISRSEFTYAVSRLLNNDAGRLGAKSPFYDTKDNKWEEYIAALAAMNIVEGCAGNVFEPDRTVTEFEAVKILVRALGYTYISEAKGGSNEAYLKEAADCKLTRGISVSYTNGLSREKCIGLLFNALTVPIAEQSDFGKNVSFKTEKDQTAMSLYHDVYKSTGRITSVGGRNAAPGIKTSKNELIINSESYINGFAESDALLGMKVKYYYKDSNEEKGKRLIFAICAQEVKIVRIEAEDITEAKEKSVTYCDEGGSRHTEKIAIACDVIKNGVPVEKVNDNTFKIKNGEIILIDNEDRGEYDTVFIKSYINYVVKSVEEDNETIKINTMFGMPRVDIDLSASVVIRTADGAAADISAIEENSVISVSADKTRLLPSGKETVDNNSTCFEIYASTERVSGIYNAKTENSVFVDDTEYETAAQNFLGETKIDIGSSVTVMLDKFGKEVSWEIEETAFDAGFGYLINGKVTNAMGTKMEIKLMNGEGEVIVRKVNDKCRLNSIRIKSYDALINSLYESARHANPQKTDMTQLIKYSENENGEISYIETTLCSSGVPQGEDKNHLRISGSKLKLSRKGGDNFWDLNTRLTGCVVRGSTKFFVVPIDNYDGDDENFRKINVNDTTWQLYETYAKTVDLYNFDDTIIPEVVVIYGTSADEAIENWVMVDKIEDVLDDNGDAEKRIKVISGWNGAKSVPLEYPEKFADLKQGDVITLYGRNDKARSYTMHFAFEKAKQYAKLYKKSADATLSVSENEMTSFGEVYAQNGNAVKLQCGAYKEGTVSNERETQWGALWTDTSGYLSHGSVVYDGEKSKPKIEKMQKSKIVCAKSNPDNPDLAYIYYKNGQPQVLIFYKGISDE